MRVKELVHWVDSFGLPSAPWSAEPTADWATALNLMARLLCRTLADRVEQEQKGKEQSPEEKQEQLQRRDSQQHPSIQLPLQEALHMAESALGAPQLAVLADTKTKQEPDNQLALFVTLCTLRFAIGQADTKPYRDFQFTFRIYFDMDTDQSARHCAACGETVHFIERSVLLGRVWHRACLKCSLCGRQLYRGAFHCAARDGLALECVEHFANTVLFDDPKLRLALAPPVAAHHSDKRASLISCASSSVCSPPPRPPPPRISGTTPTAAPREQHQEEEDSVEKKIALAAAAPHDAPVPRPRTTRPGQSTALHTLDMNRGMGKEKTSWEVLEYPEELNPFGEEEEGDGREGENSQPANNPFEDTDSEEEEGDADGDEGIVQVQNPQDRVLASPECSSCPSPAARNHPPMVHIMTENSETKEGAGREGSRTAVVKAPGEDQGTRMDYRYIAPLAPMCYGRAQLQQTQTSSIVAATSSSTTDSVAQRHSLHELDTRLRKLHAQLDQWEITGARLEGQLLREMANKEKSVWRKGGNSKLVNEFATVLEQRCAALAHEGVLVRRYMDAFLCVAHAELDQQMKDDRFAKNEGKQRQFSALLAHLLHVRNELTDLESAELETKTRIAKEQEAVEEAERERKAKKKEEKGKKKEKEKERETIKGPMEASQLSEQSAEGGKESRKEETPATAKRPNFKGVKQTLKTLKKKL